MSKGFVFCYFKFECFEEHLLDLVTYYSLSLNSKCIRMSGRLVVTTHSYLKLLPSNHSTYFFIRCLLSSGYSSFSLAKYLLIFNNVSQEFVMSE